jgi:phospholipid transport system transporter-binding protein
VSKLKLINQGGGYFLIDGDLTFDTIDKQTVKSFAFLNSSKDISIDFSKVACTDSAGLALMIEWLKYTRSKRIHLKFKNIPKQLHALAQLSGFDKTSHFTIQAD